MFKTWWPKLSFQVDKYASPRECMKNLHWLPISKTVEHKILTVVYKCIRGLAPKYLQDLIKERIPSRPRLYSSGSLTKLVVPHVTRQTFMARAFSMCSPSLWNSLPANFTEASTVDKFKTKLKTHMLRDVYNQELLATKL